MKLSRKLFAILTVGITGVSYPAFAKDYHKGIYNTFYVGAARFKDIYFETEGSRGLDPGFEYQLGIGYDFGKRYRIESSYTKSISNFEGTSSLNATAYSELVATTFGINAFVDFPNESGVLAPFLGVGLGISNLNIRGADKADNKIRNTDLMAGVSYELSNNVDFDAKYTFRYFEDTTLGLLEMNNVGMHSLIAGVRFHF
tara:strand:+ start:6 stop:605 length:600 start_codon:yes stop_codon:yes gene_type:complete